MEKKRPGRKKKLLNDPDTLNKIIALGSQGLTSGQIARCLGVSWSTIDRRRKENAEIEEAIKKGEALGVEKISNALMTSHGMAMLQHKSFTSRTGHRINGQTDRK